MHRGEPDKHAAGRPPGAARRARGDRAHRPHDRAARHRPTGWRASPRASRRSGSAASGCTAATCARRRPRARCRSGSTPGWPSAPASMHRRGAACWRSTSWRGAAASAACWTWAAARAFWRSPPRSAGRRACSRSTTTRWRSPWRGTTPARTASRPASARAGAKATAVPPCARAGPYDLIFANILADPLCAMARDLARHLAPGGSAILVRPARASGIALSSTLIEPRACACVAASSSKSGAPSCSPRPVDGAQPFAPGAHLAADLWSTLNEGLKERHSLVAVQIVDYDSNFLTF